MGRNMLRLQILRGLTVNQAAGGIGMVRSRMLTPREVSALACATGSAVPWALGTAGQALGD